MKIEVGNLDAKKLEEMFARLEGLEGAKPVREGLAKAGALFVAAGRGNLGARLGRYATGSLMNSFTVRVKRRKPDVLAGFVRSGKKVRYAASGNHAHLVDLGAPAENRKGRGEMPANYFWTDAKSQAAGAAMRAVEQGVRAAAAAAFSD